VLLAVDSSGDRLQLGLADQGRVLAGFDGPPQRNHSERLITELDRLLGRAQVELSSLDHFAVVTGPGSFTGLRVGIATILGLTSTRPAEIVSGGTHVLHHLHLQRIGREAIVVIHCRGESYFVSPEVSEIDIIELPDIIRRHRDQTLAGPAAAKLKKEASNYGPGYTFDVLEESGYNGGELALLFEQNLRQFKRLSPADVQIDYLVKSQPERLADEKKPQVYITEMSEGDLDDIVRIEQSTFTDAWSRNSFERDLVHPDVITLVARIDDRCVGYCDCPAIDDYGYLANVAVDSKLRSQGIGWALMDELCYRLRVRGKRTILLDVRVSNQRAIEFYKRYGFSVLVRRADFYTNPVEDSYTMSLGLND
jgi:ribosomal-protein-alanine N-acetyltransferase